MNEEQIKLYTRQVMALERIANALERMAPPPTAPNYQRDLKEFNDFNWHSIGAKIVKVDEWGVAIVEWQGYHFTRRNPQNKYEPAIWYSRCTGKGDNGNVYEKLITFKSTDRNSADPIPEKIRNLL
ncbi:MAG TPA: single-stranded DNA-binding protein [Nostocaceae cyanobacterium]|nr:single-stranded DNA-binding protein [Nostocaceae cyanobacterium]